MCVFPPSRLGFAQEGEKERAKKKKHTHTRKLPFGFVGFWGASTRPRAPSYVFFIFLGGFWARALVIG